MHVIPRGPLFFPAPLSPDFSMLKAFSDALYLSPSFPDILRKLHCNSRYKEGEHGAKISV